MYETFSVLAGGGEGEKQRFTFLFPLTAPNLFFLLFLNRTDPACALEPRSDEAKECAGLCFGATELASEGVDTSETRHKTYKCPIIVASKGDAFKN